jgi:hypothetical protein
LSTAGLRSALVFQQLAVGYRACYDDPAAPGAVPIAATAGSWRRWPVLATLGLEWLQHVGLAFAADVSWNKASLVDSIARASMLNGPGALPPDFAFAAAALIALGWLGLAGWLTLSLAAPWDPALRARLPPGIRADAPPPWRQPRPRSALEGPWPLLLSTALYMAALAGLLQQLHCSADQARRGGGRVLRGHLAACVARHALHGNVRSPTRRLHVQLYVRHTGRRGDGGAPPPLGAGAAALRLGGAPAAADRTQAHRALVAQPRVAPSFSAAVDCHWLALLDDSKDSILGGSHRLAGIAVIAQAHRALVAQPAAHIANTQHHTTISIYM